ncbi:hypothetical protein M0L20_18130 [Spirosoma sp. RP8]|uniref:Uncharacterized protein n=1 Tax=Spirosoma liriopis TaxID=2937440 RepID=A0ABT0HQF2_9BACT|nr:hypothetical protein [Spirosoma liriopis]MCK8493790.1 hypothetical protein [Spirosoma liriopis]
MLKNPVSGSFLASLLPSFALTFLANATQEQVNQAEQEAAVIHQQLQAATVTPPAVPPVTPAQPTAAVPPVASATPAVTTPVAPVAQGTMPLEIPAPMGDLANQLTAMTSRATTAEASVNTLTAQLTNTTNELGQYKAWYQKMTGQGTALPVADASNRGQQVDTEQPTLSAASSSVLTAFQNRNRTK